MYKNVLIIPFHYTLRIAVYVFLHRFIAYEILRSSGDDLQIIISTEKVRVFSCNTGSVKGCAVVIETNLR